MGTVVTDAKIDAPTAAAASKPLVSVMVAVYNHERYVVECLDSIVRGTYPNLDIIVVDDASQDRSDEIVREWIARHPEVPVRYIHHVHNVGFARSLNEAISLSRGAYFCPVAADDVLLPDGIATRVAYLERHPEKLAVFGDAHVIDDVGNVLFQSCIEDLPRHRHVLMRKDLLRIDDLMPFNIVFHWAVSGSVLMCRTQAFQIVGPFDEKLVIEDWDMYLRLAVVGGLGFLDEYVSLYRTHGASQSATLGVKKRTELSAAARKNLRHVGIINGIRLAAMYMDSESRTPRSLPSRILYLVASRVLLLVSYRAYVLRRAAILRKHRARGEGLSRAQ